MKKMTESSHKRLLTLGFGLVLILGIGHAGAQAGVEKAGAPGKPRPAMDVVFVLDTTGSMAGLIQTAKEKIWAIANEILRGKPTPRLRIGLVAYRDKSDAYVTKLFGLTDDLDQVHRNLMGFQAAGGGDTPEHVNKALHDAVHGMAWTGERRAVKIIFLVGDAPPHMDYGDGFDYREAARAAIHSGIMVNTLRIGSIGGTEEVWREIARLADGSYKEIKVAAAMPHVATKYDAELMVLRRKLGRARVATLGGFAAPGSAAAFDGRGKFRGVAADAALEARADLISEIIAGRVKIEKVPEAMLTPELKKLEGEARVAKLQALVSERRALLAELKSLEKKRNEAVAKELKERSRKEGLDKSEDSFGRAVVDAVKKAATKAGIRYEDEKKKAEEKKPAEKPAEKTAPEKKTSEPGKTTGTKKTSAE